MVALTVMLGLGWIAGILDIYKSLMSTLWPHTTGGLMNWEMYNDPDGDLSIEKFVYSYKVNDTEYKSTNIGFGVPRKSGYSEAALNQVLINAPEVVVYFNPRNPQVSTLIVGLKQYHLVNLFLFFLGIVCIYAFYN